MYKDRLSAIEFFAGSGMVTGGLSPYFRVLWANDVSKRKAAVYVANHGAEHFVLGDIKDVRGKDLPNATLVWGSFPCQDLSLAGKSEGIYARRSGLVWEWLRVVDELPSRPQILVAENVMGLLSSQKGRNYLDLHEALIGRGYNVGALVCDAVRFVPQSRPRLFIIAVDENLPIQPFCSQTPVWCHQSVSLRRVARAIDRWVWWNVPEPPPLRITLEDVIERNAPCPDEKWQEYNIRMIPQGRLNEFLLSSASIAVGYRRMRKGIQTLEIRFDGIAGCLRTVCGGSSKQIVLMKTQKGLKARFMTAHEAARLMGAPISYKLPGSLSDGYNAMGDAVALPVVEYLAKNLLYPLAREAVGLEKKYRRAV